MRKISPSGELLLSSLIGSNLEQVSHVGKDGFVYLGAQPSSFLVLTKLDENLNVVEAFDSDPLISPVAIDSDYDGNLYAIGLFTWGANDYVLAKFKNNGEFVWGIDQIGHELSARLSFPHRIRYRDGRLYAAISGWLGFEHNVRDILVFDAEDGTRLDDIGPFNASPFDVDVAPLDQTVVAKYGEPWKLGHVKHSEVVEKPWYTHLERFRELRNEPETPPTGMCVVWLDDDGDFKVKFDNGVVKVIASPT